jgi:polysaccharide deacetylase 2 family uncharacterized protein YibQ
LARTGFIAFAGFFLGSVVTGSIAWLSQEQVAALPPAETSMSSAETPPVPAVRPAPTVAAPEGPSMPAIPRQDVTVSPVPPIPATSDIRQPHLEGEPVDAMQAFDEKRLAGVVASVPKQKSDRRRTEPMSPDGAARDLPPWRRYAALSPVSDGRPKIAIVLDDVGLSQYRSDRVVALPRPVTVAVLPYGHNLNGLVARARAAGHEILLHLPMEPNGKDVNPGPDALLTGLSAAELDRRIVRNLDRLDGYVGINNHMGSRFTASEDLMDRVMLVLKRRGLMFLDSMTTERSVGLQAAARHGVPSAVRDVFIDAELDADFVRKQLHLVENLARQRGMVVAIGHPHPVTMRELERWLPTLSDRGFVQVPVSAIAELHPSG